MSATIVQKRLKKLQAWLEKIKLDAAVIDHETDLLYLTGRKLSAGKLFVFKSKVWLFVDARYFESCLSLNGVEVKKSEEHPLEAIFVDLDLLNVKNIGFDSSKTSYASYQGLEKAAKKTAVTLMPVLNPLKELRAIKDDEELEKIAAANALCAEGYDYLLTRLKVGVKEIDLANDLEIFWKKRGAFGPAFDPIIAFGANTSMPHYRSGEAVLKENDPVLIDIGVKLDSYTSDMTRTVFFGGVEKKMQEIYGVVLEAQLLAISLLKAGSSSKSLDLAARDLISDRGYGQAFLHSLGHGLGLEVHEYPTLKSAGLHDDAILKPGMVVTIEPGIYLPGIGGVRIEDTLAVTEDGAVNLTNRPKELLVIKKT